MDPRAKSKAKAKAKPKSRSRSKIASTSASTSNPQKRIKLTLANSQSGLGRQERSSSVANVGGNEIGGPSTKRQKQTRMMDVKVLYTLESNPGQTMVARLGSQASISLQHGPTAKSPDRPWFGTITLKTCLSAICGASPELIFDRTRDYVLYAVDPIETYRSSKSSKSLSMPSQTRSPGSSKYRQSSYLVGKSMFNWGLQEPGDGHTMVTGRVCAVGGRESEDEYDSEDEDMMSEEDEEEEVLEVVLKLKETESRSKEQYYDAVKGFSSASSANTLNAASASTTTKPQTTSSKQGSTLVETEVQVTDVEEPAQPSQSNARKLKRRKLDRPQSSNSIQPQANSVNSRPASRLAVKRTKSTPLQSESSPAGSFVDIGALATSSSPPFDPSPRYLASLAASSSTLHQQSQQNTLSNHQAAQTQEVRPEQAQQLLHLLHAVGEQARQPGAESNPFQQNQAHLVQVLSSLAGALGAQSNDTPTPCSRNTPSGNRDGSMPPPSMPAASSSMTVPSQSRASSPNFLASVLQKPTLTSHTPRALTPSVSFTAPSSEHQVMEPEKEVDPPESTIEDSSPQDWSFLFSSLDKSKEMNPPNPPSQTSDRSTTTANTGVNPRVKQRIRIHKVVEPPLGTSEEICYTCGITKIPPRLGTQWKLVEIPQDEEVNNPSAWVNFGSSRKSKGMASEAQTKDDGLEVEADGMKSYRSCTACRSYRARHSKNRPERIWAQQNNGAPPSDASIVNANGKSSSSIPVFDFQDGEGGCQIGVRGIEAGGVGGRRFSEVGLNSTGPLSKQLGQFCESREIGSSALLDDGTGKEKATETEENTEQVKEKGQNDTKNGKAKASTSVSRRTKAATTPSSTPQPSWASVATQPGNLPEPIFDAVTGRRTRAPAQPLPLPQTQSQTQPQVRAQTQPQTHPQFPNQAPSVKAPAVSSEKATDLSLARSRSSSSKSKAVHFGQSSPIRPSIAARATFNGISNSSPDGRSGFGNFLQSSPGLNGFMSNCGYDFGSMSFPGFGNEGGASFEESNTIGKQFDSEEFEELESMRLLRRSPRRLPSGTKIKNNPYASSMMAIPASPTPSLGTGGSNLGFNRREGGPASMGVLTSSVSPMTRSRARSSNGVHPAMLSSSIGRKPSQLSDKKIGDSSDTSPGSPTPSSQLKSDGSKRITSNKRKAAKNLAKLDSPNLDLGLWVWDKQEDNGEEGKEDELTQEMDASPSSSRRNRKSTRSAQSSELSRGPFSGSNLLGSSTHHNQRLRSGRLGSQASGHTNNYQEEEDAFFNTSNPTGSSPSIFELALQNKSAKSPASTNNNQESTTSIPDPSVTPKKRGASTVNVAKAPFRHLREESAASAQSPLWGGGTPASEKPEFVAPAELPSAIGKSQSISTQVQATAPARIPRKPLPATVEDAPSSSGGESPYDDDEYYDDEEPSPAESGGLFEGFEDPYGLLAASGIGLNPQSSTANQSGVNMSSDTFREAIELYASSQFGSQLRDFTQNGGTGIAAHIDPNASSSNLNQAYGEIQGAIWRDGQAQIGSSSQSNDYSSHLPSTPRRSRNPTSSSYFPTGLTPGMTPISLSALNQISSNNAQALPSHIHSSTQASPGILNALLNDPSWRDLLATFASPQRPKANGSRAQIMSAEEQSGEGVASGGGNVAQASRP